MKWIGWAIAAVLALALVTQLNKTRSLELELASKLQSVKPSPEESVYGSPGSKISQGSPGDQLNCSQLAKQFYREYERTQPKMSKDEGRNFNNHFDPSTQSCYVEIGSALIQPDGAVINAETVFNVNENSVLAEFWRKIPAGKAQWEAKPTVCRLKLPNGQEKFCHSEDEYYETARELFGVAKP